MHRLWESQLQCIIYFFKKYKLFLRTNIDYTTLPTYIIDISISKNFQTKNFFDLPKFKSWFLSSTMRHEPYPPTLKVFI